MKTDPVYELNEAFCEGANGIPEQPGEYSRYIPAHQKERSVYPVIKRALDLVLSVAALVCLFPFLLIVAVCIKMDSEGPALYSQMRAGKNGKPFRMYKFRSMCKDADEKLGELRDLNEKDGPVFKMAKDPRVTRVGRVIRKYSVDELPQLINIFLGDMSVVGPRPPLLTEVEQYTPHQRGRLGVKPGLTCYWQISGRSDLTFDRWVAMDLQYIAERSLRTDIKIILKTVPAALFGKGAY